MEYRREIDGLRAVAVVPVILFHAGFETFSGGFVGVDVFFVISGFLITTIILAEQERGTFSIVKFYERRARRILPALFFVMFACLPFAWLWLRPSDLKDFFQSVAAVSIFSSNMLFWIESGYFEAAAELKPLLHTWSLAVEEQYYVLFPLFLMTLWAFRKRWIFGALITLGVASLVFAQWGAQNMPAATFFLLPMRAWELMVGASVAFFVMYGKHHADLVAQNKAVRELLALIGGSLILYSIFAFDETVPFPSVYALVPTIGVALIILFATADTIVGQVLGHRALVGVGLISYSAYLWHQPLFVFARHRSLIEPTNWMYLVLSLLTLLLAYFSWRFVEKPFRIKGVVSRKAIFSSAVIGSGLFFGVGAVGHFMNGFDERTGHDGVALTELDERIRVNHGLSEECEGEFTLSPECRTADNPEVLLWGDSFAMHLVQGIMSSNPSTKMLQLTKSVCGPFFGLAPTSNKYPIPWAEGCLEFSESVRDYIASSNSIKYVVLASPFIQYVPGEYKLFIDGAIRDQDAELVFDQFISTLKQLEDLGVQPIVFAPTPSHGVDIGQCLVKASFFGDQLDACNFSYSNIVKEKADVFEFLSNVATQYPVVWLSEYICSEGECLAHIDSTFIYRDRHHLSHEGSAALGRTADFFALITDEERRAAAKVPQASGDSFVFVKRPQ